MNPDRLRRAPWVLRYRVGPRLASRARQVAVEATHRHCHVEFRGPVRLGPGFTLEIPDNGTLVVGSGVDFRRGFVCEISGGGVVTIGDGSIFTSNVRIQCTTSIDIGRRCVFAQDVLLVDGKHRYGDPEVHSLEQGYDYRPLHIGDSVVVMSKSTVVADIGEGAFIGAHSLVTRPIPAHCLAFGTPAKPAEYFRSPVLAERVLTAER